ncbi:AAA ATPase domain protein [compost metagenome]|uniref:AAA domain-containing protein n=1 Tax=Pseudomonas jinjuensis TaxID=198616 RepID=A0A1H0DPU2_9PSED|nr:AAA family ATPase [Pseudomonas jinjuensis]SDN72076.1 AAA domain-containing protein [Pseudomonas jinjuensis]
MGLSNEMRRLQAKWNSGGAWPKRLEGIEINNIRGWTGQRLDFKFPIVAIVGENGCGKSTVIQAAASIYKGRNKKATRFASDFFPATAWDDYRNAQIRYHFREGESTKTGLVRKPTTRWLGNDERPTRDVEYVDLSRIQPVSARVGYSKIAKSNHVETSATEFEERRVERLSTIMGRKYKAARMALSNVDAKRRIPVLEDENYSYSGFHQGTGETTMLEFLQADINEYGMLIIDEIETSLHPRAQRRLIRALAEICRERQAQIILTTHSPYILDELPMEARMYILGRGTSRQVVSGVSANFAMTNMDDESHPDCELYVEDEAAKAMLIEIISAHAPSLSRRCRIIPFGAANLGRALGEMAANKRFPRPTCVFLDGDVSESKGCVLLPGDDAPERVVFESLNVVNWGALHERLGREYSKVADACSMAMTLDNHHQWVDSAASQLHIPGAYLWQAMCSVWANDTLDPHQARNLIQHIEDQML